MNFSLIKEQVSLKDLNTMRIPVMAAYFAKVVSVDEVQEVLRFANENDLQILVLGGGSNIVLTKDWDGLVLQMAISGVEMIENRGDDILGKLNENEVKIKVGAGMGWHDLVVETVNNGWFGFENLALIPGTVGAAPVQNIGAYGKEVAEFIDYVKVVSVKDGAVKVFLKNECEFGYRSSIFYGKCPNEYVIVEVGFILSRKPNVKAIYPSLLAQLENDGIDVATVTPKQILENVVKVRESKLPDFNVMPNAGSFFKNPIVTDVKFAELSEKFVDITGYKVDEGYKLAAGWLIEKAGFKGYSQDGVGVYEHNALVLVNPGRCKGDKILELANKIQQAVLTEFGVEIETEPLKV